MLKLDNIQFGLARAELEAARFPTLLTDGFLDNRNIVDFLINGFQFLVVAASNRKRPGLQ